MLLIHAGEFYDILGGAVNKMEISFLGHASFKIRSKAATIVCDPFDEVMVGMKFPKIDNVDIVTVSHDHEDHNHTQNLSGFIIKGPGEYEISGVTIVGIATWHDAKNGQERGTNTVYNLKVDGVQVCHLGDLGHKLTDDQVDRIDNVDILLVPVGGKDFTINAKTASEVVAQLEPRIVIPMHYDGKMGLDPVENFLKEMGIENIAPIPKLITSREKLPETTTVVRLQ